MKTIFLSLMIAYSSIGLSQTSVIVLKHIAKKKNDKKIRLNRKIILETSEMPGVIWLGKLKNIESEFITMRIKGRKAKSSIQFRISDIEMIGRIKRGLVLFCMIGIGMAKSNSHPTKDIESSPGQQSIFKKFNLLEDWKLVTRQS